MNTNKRLGFSGVMFYVVNILFMINVFGILLSVIVDSFGTSWNKGTWLPDSFSTKWWEYLAGYHDIGHLLWITMLITLLTVIFSLIIAYPAAYVMAKRRFFGKNLIMGLFLLPILIPPISYGLPLAILMYTVKLATTVAGVVIANMVPTVSFMILVIMPFIEQIGDNVESASRMLGANKLQFFSRILIPLTIPGILSASILSIVRVISMFELTFLVSGAKTQTLIVMLFADVNSPGFRPYQMIDALAMIFFLLTIVFAAISMKIGNPTSIYSKI